MKVTDRGKNTTDVVESIEYNGLSVTADKLEGFYYFEYFLEFFFKRIN